MPDGTPVKKGDLVSFMPYVLSRSPKLWPEPMKVCLCVSVSLCLCVFTPFLCLQFDPERFRTNPMPTQYHYPVFNAGPRICLGKGLALLETKLVIAAVLHKYRMVLKPDHVVHYKVNCLRFVGCCLIVLCSLLVCS